MPFKMHKRKNSGKKNIKNTCVPTLPKFFRPVTQNTLIFYLALLAQMGCLFVVLFDPLLLKVTALLQQIFSAGPVGVELGSLAVQNVVVVKAVPGSL